MSHGSSTVPRYIVDEINELGGNIQNAYGISLTELKAAIPAGINKINIDTDIRLAVTRNMRELFAKRPELQKSESIGGVYKLLLEHPENPDPRAFLPPVFDTVMYGVVEDDDRAALVAAIEAGVKEAVSTLIVEFGSFGKAPKVEVATLAEMAEHGHARRAARRSRRRSHRGHQRVALRSGRRGAQDPRRRTGAGSPGRHGWHHRWHVR